MMPAAKTKMRMGITLEVNNEQKPIAVVAEVRRWQIILLNVDRIPSPWGLLT